MRTGPSDVLIALCLTAIGSAAIGQQTAQVRQALIGTVVDHEGQPLAGAAVHCVVAEGMLRGRPIEHLVGETDQRGRFVLKVRPCTQHRVWAIGPVEGDNGARRASQPV